MASNKRVFTLRLSDEVFDKIGALATKQHRSMTNYIEFVLEKANSIFPSDAQRIELRKAHLLEARASLKALDVRLTHCYLVIMQNPEGGFTTSKGNSVSPKEATEKLDRMAASLGEMIDNEDELIKGTLKSLGQIKKS